LHLKAAGEQNEAFGLRKEKEEKRQETLAQVQRVFRQ
jgi:hypothetical protein